MRAAIRVRLMPAMFVGAVLSACTTVLGLGDYTIRSGGADAASEANPEAAAATVDVAVEAGVPDASYDAIGCDADPTRPCYPCAPSTPAQLVNACTSVECVSFDDTTRLTHLLPDGGLPPLPPVRDGGTE